MIPASSLYKFGTIDCRKWVVAKAFVQLVANNPLLVAKYPRLVLKFPASVYLNMFIEFLFFSCMRVDSIRPYSEYILVTDMLVSKFY